MAYRRHHRGYVLLLTLLLLAVAGAAMATVCRYSLQRAVAAARDQEDLQRRWGMLSCRAVLLPSAEALLAAAEARSRAPQAKLSTTLALGRQQFTLLFADEQAKVNLNAVHRRGGKHAVEQSLRQLLSRTSSGLQVRVRPPMGETHAPGEPTTDEPPFRSLGQLLDSPAAQQLIGLPGDWGAAVDDFTCWGDGQLNIRRASRTALAEFCTPLLDRGQIDQLLAIRRDRPRMDRASVLGQLQLSREKRSQLMGLLTDRSACHSLWIIAQAPGGASSYTLSIIQKTAAGSLWYSFAW